MEVGIDMKDSNIRIIRFGKIFELRTGNIVLWLKHDELLELHEVVTDTLFKMGDDDSE